MQQQIELEIGGTEQLPEGLIETARVEYLCGLALASAAVEHAHLAIEFVTSERIQELNSTYRGIDKPTDVLSFPIDSTTPAIGPRELGDVIVCTEHCDDVTEAVLHGVLHLLDLDHETDCGQMLALQRELLSW